MGRKRKRHKKGKHKSRKPIGPPSEAPACSWLLVKNPGGFRDLQFGSFLTEERAIEWVAKDATRYVTGMFSASRPSELKWQKLRDGGMFGKVEGHSVEYLIKHLEVQE